MKAIFLGYKGSCGQVARIEDGWKLNGNLICKQDETPDLIYANDSGYYDEAINLKNKYSNAKLILNVLDIPKKYYPNLNLEELKSKLLKADIVTTISEFSKKQVVNYLNINPIVIYNPIKDVYNQNLERDIDFLYVGRLYEDNKRFNLALESLSLVKIKIYQLFIAGPDNPGRGLNYLGSVDDYTLNMLYNRSKFLICPTEYGVLGLPPIEAAICGCIPILCNDNEAAKEFKLEEFSFNPNPNEIANQILTMDIKKQQDKLKKIGEELFNLLNKKTIAINIANLLC